jgi:hypothetical protein
LQAIFRNSLQANRYFGPIHGSKGADTVPSVSNLISSENSEKGTDFTSPVNSILTSAIYLPNTDFFESISISFP